MARVYATLAELADWYSPDPVPDGITDRDLSRASRLIDNNLLKTAFYDVDTDGYPTDQDQRTAVRDACCALVEWWEANGDDGTGAGGNLTSVTAGSISYSRGSRSSSSGGGGDDPRISREAVEILAAAFTLRGVSMWDS
ncbi:hypothetical protein HII36_29755 [Nonomuraea sp. NN258]|uniref:hypothetical protein n=1 Tax=Nonomuraea antri TaxID=2730852 RepID=UPI00156A4491|nr:hypothetical protein [Nonomuraea antri]NRQ35986.1 hypothetical protein [Nonomuraea antri]